ncbi:MAG: hypothetical protein DK306_001374 [Chloroflexi bacterium]|nr:MAG: hypothetical protein DK306_001374 [Chloroflexota bacterium]
MVTPDYSAFNQDRAAGLVRDLHETIAQSPRSLRNQPTADYGALLRLPRMLSTQSEDGYLLGIPYGRHLKLYYEFEMLGALQSQLRNLVSDIGELALKHTDCRIMALEFDDFPSRHHVDHSFVGAAFRDPLPFMLMRCRDMREQHLPDAPDGVTTRAATDADADAISALETSVSGEAALGPPLPDGFLATANTVLLAERDGAVVGYIRLVDAEKRGLMAEEFLVDEDGGEDAAIALLRTTMENGKAADRRPLTIRVSADAGGDAVFKSFGFKHSGDGLQYLRLADSEAAQAEIKKRPTYLKVGKIFGRF